MREFSYTNVATICVTEADFSSISSMLEEPVMSWNTDLANWLKYVWLPLFGLTPSPVEGFPWDDLRKILVERSQVAKVRYQMV